MCLQILSTWPKNRLLGTLLDLHLLETWNFDLNWVAAKKCNGWQQSTISSRLQPSPGQIWPGRSGFFPLWVLFLGCSVAALFLFGVIPIPRWPRNR